MLRQQVTLLRSVCEMLGQPVTASQDTPLRNPTQKLVESIMRSPWCECFISGAVFVGMIFVIIDLNNNADDIPEPTWLRACQLTLLFVYLIDIFAQAYVYRWWFFYDRYRIIDTCTITIDCCITLADAVSPTDFPVGLARAARIIKIARVLRAMSQFPELNVIIKGTFMAARSLFWGVLLLFITVNIWSILGVVLIHPLVKDLDEIGVWDHVGCERCPRAFRNWQNSMVTFCTTVVAGGDLGQIAIPIMEYYPATSVYFAVVFLVSNLLVLNLLMSMVVERALEATKLTAEEEARAKVRAFEHARQQLTVMAEGMDTNQDGFLSWSEFEASFQANKEFESYLKEMDIEMGDLQQLFHTVDADGNGSISPKEFSTQLFAMRHRDMHTTMSFLTCHVLEIQKQLKDLSHGGRKMTSRQICSKCPSPPPLWPKCTQSSGLVRFARALQKLDDIRYELLEFASDDSPCTPPLTPRQGDHEISLFL